MDDLRRLFTEIGCRQVETFIASGNVIFAPPRGTVPALIERIEHHLHRALGFEVRTFLRTGAELDAIARHPPFPASQVQSAGALVVGFLAGAPGAAARRALATLTSQHDVVEIHGRELYWLTRGRQSESPLSNAVFERALGVAATFRSITTVARLAERYGPSAGSG